MANIAIIGAGWVGAPLASKLKQEEHFSVVTRRSQEALSPLQESGLIGFVCDLSDNNSEAQLIEAFKQYRIDTVVAAFPPGFRKGLGKEYVEYCATLARASRQANITKIVMISSTAVYPDKAETMSEDMATLTQAQNNPDFSEKSTLMLMAEQQIIDSGINYVVLRFSGLYGPERHPARFVRMLKQVSRNAPANMLHLDDAVDITVFAINNVENEVVNATSPETVSKAEFYQRAVECFHEKLDLPKLVNIKDKRVDAAKSLSLGYQYHYGNTLDGLSHL